MNYQSEQVGAIAKALCAAQSKITFALKESVADMGNKGGRRKYADLQSVIDAVKPALVENEICYTQQLMPAGNGGISLRTMLMHSSGEWIAGVLDLPADRMGGIQGMGSAITYARRYALSALVGVAPDEDDDGQKAQDEYNRGGWTKEQRDLHQDPTAVQKAKAKEVWDALGRAGFPDKESRLGEIRRITGKPIQASGELSLADLSLILETLEKTANGAF